MQNDITPEEQVPLAPLTTMRVGGTARYLVRITNENQVQNCVDWAAKQELPVFILGGGSNIVVSDSGWDGAAVKMENTGIDVLRTSQTYVDIRVQAGVCWDDLVAHTVQKGWWGIENMSLIPGSVGACPVQNVGAYGQECRQVITLVKAYDMLHRQWTAFDRSECNFGLRSSIFNTTQKGRYIITAVDFRLSTQPKPCLKRSALVGLLRKKGKDEMDQEAIRDVIIELRTNGKMLPKPDTLGSAGTFFRPSLVPHFRVFHLLLKTWRSLGAKAAVTLLKYVIHYSTRAGAKIPSRLILEACGFKGFKCGAFELFQPNPAVVATHTDPPPKADDIINLIQLIRSTVYAKTGLELPVEPDLVGFSSEYLHQAFTLPTKKLAGGSLAS